MQEAIQERNDALATLEGQVYELSRLFREGYLSAGRGALIVHTTFLEGGHKPSIIDYNTREESLELFDVTKSTRKLTRMIDGYDPNLEGIMVLIAKSSATWFVTVKLKSHAR